MQQQFPSYWSLNDKVDFLQRKILISSVSERQLGIEFLNKDFRNNIVQQLIDLQDSYPDASNTLYGYAFKDFTADKYYDLYLELNEFDREQFDKICRLYDNGANNKMENYYILEEYINRGDD